MAQKSEDSVRFSIGAKLKLIISLITLVSLGVIIAVFYLLSYNDLLAAAEENNIDANKRAAAQAQSLLSGVFFDSRALIQTAFDSQTFNQQTAVSYFNKNPQIAAVFLYNAANEIKFVTNLQLFSSWGFDESHISSFIDSQSAAFERVMRRETFIVNAAGHFSKPALAMFFPWQDTAAGVIFSYENLDSYFASPSNNSYMINASGDILVSGDFLIAYNRTNIGDLEFVKAIIESGDQSNHWIIKTDFSVSGVSEIGNKRFFTSILENVLKFIKPVIDRCKVFISNIINFFNNKPIDEKSPQKAGERRQIISFTKFNATGAYVITSAEYNEIFKGLNEALLLNILIAVLLFIVSIIIISVLSKTFSSPVKSLTAAARQISDGNFNQALQITNSDEIGALSSSFNRMSSNLRTFARFTNKDVALKSINGEINDKGFLKHGIVMFSDIVDFTDKLKSFSAVFGDEASDKMVQWLNQYYSRMTECVEKTNGYVDKFIGDGIMAHWGTVSTEGNSRKDAFCCIKAALMMRKTLFYMNKQRKHGDYSTPLIQMGFGIASGMVTAGLFGGETHSEFSVIGNCVNLASRINALTKRHGVDILVSEDTWSLIGDKFITREMPSENAGAEGQPIRTYAIINFFGESKGPQSLDELRAILGTNVN